ncbi:MAG TPA: metallothionein [Gammaproteobacteria bacterium]|nr:metallothionein [Gammaproteobacteria bacterium]
MSDTDESNVCAHQPCTCEVREGGLEREGKRYCSQGCFEGTGCEHPGCNCHVPQVPG